MRHTKSQVKCLKHKPVIRVPDELVPYSGQEIVQVFVWYLGFPWQPSGHLHLKLLTNLLFLLELHGNQLLSNLAHVCRLIGGCLLRLAKDCWRLESEHVVFKALVGQLIKKYLFYCLILWIFICIWTSFKGFQACVAGVFEN